MDLTIKITGMTMTDLELALKEVQARIIDGMIGFRDDNDTSSYKFDIDGEEAAYFFPVKNGESIDDIDDIDDIEDLTLFDCFEDAHDVGKKFSGNEGFEIILLNDEKEEIERVKRY